MESQTQADLAVVDSPQPPQNDIVRLVVDGVSFALDVGGIHEQHSGLFKMLAQKGLAYEPVMTRSLTRLLQDMTAPRFMDIGACTGYYMCYVAALLGDTTSVTGVESNPIHCEAMRRSCDLNGFRNVQVCEAILSNQVEPASADGFSVVTGGAEGGQTAIPLDQLCEGGSIPVPNVVKIDIHGGEGKALFGMTAVLKQVDYLLLELHGHDRLEHLSPGVERSHIMKLLWDLGLTVHCLAGHTAPPKMTNREGIGSGGFAYRRVTEDNVDCLFFDRLRHQFFLVSRRDDLRGVLGESVKDSLLCYA
jgi:FkbM family methyltransferase